MSNVNVKKPKNEAKERYNTISFESSVFLSDSFADNSLNSWFSVMIFE